MSLTRLQITTNDPTRLLDSWNALGDVPVAASIEDDGTVVLAIDLTAEVEPDPVLAEIIFTAIGEASTCWANLAAAGEFDVEHALAIGRQLAADLGVVLPDGYQPPVPTDLADAGLEAAEPEPAPPPPPPAPAPASPPPVDLAGTCADAVVALLDAEPDVAFTTGQIAEALFGRYKPSSVKFTVNTIAGDRITRVRPGLYQSLMATEAAG